MIRAEKLRRLMNIGYTYELRHSLDTLWHHPEGRFTVQVRYGGRTIVWYRDHPKHWCWDGMQFYERTGADNG